MVVDRILKIIELKGINKSVFYRDTGLSNGFLDKVKDVGVSKIEKILSSYPDINPIWLLTGKPPMLLSEQNQPSEGPVNDNEVVALLKENNATLKAQLKDKEKINALQEEKIAKLEADIKRLRGKEITAMEDKIELQRQQIQHLTSTMPSVSDTAQRQNLSRL